MRPFYKSVMVLSLLIGCIIPSIAQKPITNLIKLNSGKVEPYQMEVTYNKTSHLIFPAAIRYVDLGSEYLIAGKAEDAQNVLRVKASVHDFDEETNFSVITEDGRFYNFNVLYSPCPLNLNYDLLKMQKSVARENDNDVLFEELGSNSPSLAGLILKTIYQKDKKNIKHIGSKSYGIQFLLNGIYIHNDKFYFHTELKNKSNVPFIIDFVNFKVVDKKLAKRTVQQEKSLTPLRFYKPLDEVVGNAVEGNVFMLDQFTIADEKLLLIEIFERNGGRHQVLQVENSDLVKARLITDIHLKY
ncbi:conjugative transposon protein TraN [Flavobacterium tructae]|uniref:conjugative transposon protein TraN n=1 Tax=Flavobacterium tructae TaxID=1114873 RepID=UPI002551D40D|nr:conjugative transposon protein TraN [Flavobacterium tructae]MDL2141648.1 conjugative transposon protein TraN [Flavobacterium tructae]